MNIDNYIKISSNLDSIYKFNSSHFWPEEDDHHMMIWNVIRDISMAKLLLDDAKPIYNIIDRIKYKIDIMSVNKIFSDAEVNITKDFYNELKLLSC